MDANESTNFLLNDARARDPGRCLCILLGPRKPRDVLLALLLLEQELGRVPRLVTQPMAGYIRYQWWREGITAIAAGQPRPEPILAALAPALRTGDVEAPLLHALIDSHEALMERAQNEDPAHPETDAASTSGLLHRLLAFAAGTREGRWLDAASAVGTAFGMLADWRALEPRQRPDPAPTARRALELLGEARRRGRPPRQALPAVLPAVLVERAARRLLHGQSAEGAPQPVLRLVLANALRRF